MRPASIVFHRNRSPRQPLPLGQWAEPGQTLAAKWAAIEAEARPQALPTLRHDIAGIVLSVVASVALWALIWAVWVVLPNFTEAF